MTFSLIDATVANYLQILGAVGGFLEKSRAYFHEKCVDLADIVETRLTADMLPCSKSPQSRIIRVARWRRQKMGIRPTVG